MPAIGRAVGDAARFVRRMGSGNGADVAPLAPTAGTDESITLNGNVFHRRRRWDARAQSLGGTSNTLLAAFAARLANGLGRVAADGSVTLTMPINERTAGDTRANAITNVDFPVDPVPATTDLRGIRAATKQALIRAKEEPDERWALLPLFCWCPSGSASDGSAQPPTARPAWAHPTSVQSTRP